MLFVADTYRTAVTADQHHVRQVDGTLLLGDAALDIALRVGANALLRHHHVLDQHFALVGKDPQHAAFLAFVPARDDLHGIVLANVDSSVCHVLETLGRKRDDLQALLLAQSAGYRSEDAGTHRLARLVDEHGRVLVETDIRAVAATVFLARAH